MNEVIPLTTNSLPYKKNIYCAVGLALVAVLLLCGAFHLSFTSNKELKHTELQAITGEIINIAKIKKGAKGSRTIEIKLKSYPEFSFNISGNAFAATNAARYVENVTTGDTLYLDILKDDYLKKLVQEKPLNFCDRYLNYSFISVYGLRHKNITYLYLYDYNEKYKGD
jgi:hypothetical protein